MSHTGTGDFAEKSTFHETKEVVSRLKEPLRMSFKAFRGKEHGHMIELTVNTGWDGIDELERDMTDMINMGMRIIEGPMKSKYLGISKEETQ